MNENFELSAPESPDEKERRATLTLALGTRLRTVKKTEKIAELLNDPIAEELYGDSLPDIRRVVDGIIAGSIEFSNTEEAFYLGDRIITIPALIHNALNRCRRHKKYGPMKKFFDEKAKERHQRESAPIESLDEVETLKDGLRHLDYLLKVTADEPTQRKKVIEARIRLRQLQDKDDEQEDEDSVLTADEIQRLIKQMLS